MSVKLASHTRPPPGGYIYVQKETSWDNRKASPQSVWDIRKLATDLQIHRRANHARYPYLSLNYADILKEVDQTNADRVSRIPNTEQYLTYTEDASVPKTQALPHQFFSQKLQGVVAGVAKVSAGRVMLQDWEKEGFPRVPQETAETRAATCVDCPRNEKGDWTRWFTVPASHLVKRQIEHLTEAKLATSLDDKIQVCGICLCPLRVKVHAPMEFIKRYTSPEIRGELSQVRTTTGKQCWVITSE